MCVRLCGRTAEVGCEGFWVSGHRLHHEGIYVAEDLFWSLRYGHAIS